MTYKERIDKIKSSNDLLLEAICTYMIISDCLENEKLHQDYDIIITIASRLLKHKIKSGEIE